MQRGPFTFDPLLTKAAFEVPAIKEDEVKVVLSFKIPSDKRKLPQFFDEQGAQFRKGVSNLVTELESLAKKQDILNAEAQAGLENFLEKCQFKIAKPQEATQYFIDNYKDRVFPLLTEGVTKLAEILAIIKTEENWSDSTKKEIQQMMIDFNHACEPALNTIISDTRLALSLNLKKELMSFRRKLGMRKAQEVVDQSNVEYGGETEIEIGSDRHTDLAMLNDYSEELGIEVYDDADIKRYPATKKMKEQFVKLMSKSLTASYFIDQLIEKYLPQLIKKYHELMQNPHPGDSSIVNWFEKFGTDSRVLTDLIATEDDNLLPVLKSNVDYYVRNALLIRLANSGFIDISQIPIDASDEFPDNVFHIPEADENIKIAYVSFKEKYKSDEPLVLFYIEQQFEDLKNGTQRAKAIEKLCSASQLEALQRERAVVLASEKDLLKVYLNKLAEEVFSTPEALQFLHQLLKSVREEHAGKFAKAIYHAWDAKIISEEVVKFLRQHPESADDLVELLVLFHQGLNVNLDTAFTIIAARKQYARAFVEFMQDDESREQLFDLILGDDEHEGVLDEDSVTKLLEDAHQAKDIVSALAILFSLNSALCSQAVQVIIKKGSQIDLLAFAKKIVEHSRVGLGTNNLFAFAIIDKQPTLCKLFLANGSNANDSIVVKVLLLQTILADRPSELGEYLQIKTGFSQPNPESEITVTAKELAQLVGDKEVQACFETPKTEPTAELLSKFNKFSEAITEGQEPSTHPRPPGFDA